MSSHSKFLKADGRRHNGRPSGNDKWNIGRMDWPVDYFEPEPSTGCALADPLRDPTPESSRRQLDE